MEINGELDECVMKGDSTPLMEAASGGHAEVVELLIKHNADVNAQSSNGLTPLMCACSAGHISIVKMLISAGARLEDTNDNGHTPLMEAASSGQVAVAHILIENGAGINTHTNDFKESALTLACYKGHYDMVKFLLEAGADQDHKTEEMHTALMEASMDGHVNVARLLLDSGAQVNMPADSFESPLTLAACGGHLELAMLLLQRGANIEEVNDEGYTPLMEAAREGHDEMCSLLLSHGACIDALTDETHETALTLASCGGYLEVVDLFVQAGANLELGGCTPLMEASQEGHLDVVKYLLNHTASVNACTHVCSVSETEVSGAASMAGGEVPGALAGETAPRPAAATGAGGCTNTSGGDTALSYASENGHIYVAEVLLDAGADIEHTCEGGRTCLMKSARAGHLCTVSLLLNRGAQVNRQTYNNEHTALSLACHSGHVQVVQLLLQHNADPHHVLRDNSTMIMEAAKNGHTNVIELLMDYPNITALNLKESINEVDLAANSTFQKALHSVDCSSIGTLVAHTACPASSCLAAPSTTCSTHGTLLPSLVCSHPSHVHANYHTHAHSHCVKTGKPPTGIVSNSGACVCCPHSSHTPLTAAAGDGFAIIPSQQPVSAAQFFCHGTECCAGDSSATALATDAAGVSQQHKQHSFRRQVVIERHRAHLDKAATGVCPVASTLLPAQTLASSQAFAGVSMSQDTCPDPAYHVVSATSSLPPAHPYAPAYAGSIPNLAEHNLSLSTAGSVDQYNHSQLNHAYYCHGSNHEQYSYNQQHCHLCCLGNTSSVSDFCCCCTVVADVTDAASSTENSAPISTNTDFNHHDNKSQYRDPLSCIASDQLEHYLSQVLLRSEFSEHEEEEIQKLTSLTRALAYRMPEEMRRELQNIDMDSLINCTCSPQSPTVSSTITTHYSGAHTQCSAHAHGYCATGGVCSVRNDAHMHAGSTNSVIVSSAPVCTPSSTGCIVSTEERQRRAASTKKEQSGKANKTLRQQTQASSGNKTNSQQCISQTDTKTNSTRKQHQNNRSESKMVVPQCANKEMTQASNTITAAKSLKSSKTMATQQHVQPPSQQSSGSTNILQSAVNSCLLGPCTHTPADCMCCAGAANSPAITQPLDCRSLESTATASAVFPSAAQLEANEQQLLALQQNVAALQHLEHMLQQKSSSTGDSSVTSQSHQRQHMQLMHHKKQLQQQIKQFQMQVEQQLILTPSHQRTPSGVVSSQQIVTSSVSITPTSVSSVACLQTAHHSLTSARAVDTIHLSNIMALSSGTNVYTNSSQTTAFVSTAKHRQKSALTMTTSTQDEYVCNHVPSTLSASEHNKRLLELDFLNVNRSADKIVYPYYVPTSSCFERFNKQLKQQNAMIRQRNDSTASTTQLSSIATSFKDQLPHMVATSPDTLVDDLATLHLSESGISCAQPTKLSHDTAGTQVTGDISSSTLCHGTEKLSAGDFSLPTLCDLGAGYNYASTAMYSVVSEDNTAAIQSGAGITDHRLGDIDLMTSTIATTVDSSLSANTLSVLVPSYDFHNGLLVPPHRTLHDVSQSLNDVNIGDEIVHLSASQCYANDRAAFITPSALANLNFTSMANYYQTALTLACRPYDASNIASDITNCFHSTDYDMAQSIVASELLCSSLACSSTNTACSMPLPFAISDHIPDTSDYFHLNLLTSTSPSLLTSAAGPTMSYPAVFSSTSCAAASSLYLPCVCASSGGAFTCTNRVSSCVTPSVHAPASALECVRDDQQTQLQSTDSATQKAAMHMGVCSDMSVADQLNMQTESNHDTALTLACAAGHDAPISLLLKRGANIEHRDKKGFTPLILAATAGHASVVSTLLAHSANIEAQSDRTKDTPLSLACSGGRFEAVELLLNNRANKEHRNVSDYTPLSLAASGGYVNIIRLLLQHGAEINSRTGSKLGISPLMLASMNGHTSAVKLLLDMGSDINGQIETNRNTALTLACFQGRHEVVQLLVDRKANVEHRAKTGLTPLMEAASGGYVEVGRVLLDASTDANAPPVPSSRDTALTIAADKGHHKFVELLISRGAYVEARNKKGNTPLWLASNGGHMEVIILLYNANANIDAQDNRKISCLMAAFRRGHVKCVRWMLKHVSQFPSDSECERYMTLVTDKDLLQKCSTCMTLLRVAKERQAAEANRNATSLLQELDLEQSRAKRQQIQAAKKQRDRKRKKKQVRGTESAMQATVTSSTIDTPIGPDGDCVTSLSDVTQEHSARALGDGDHGASGVSLTVATSRSLSSSEEAVDELLHDVCEMSNTGSRLATSRGSTGGVVSPAVSSWSTLNSNSPRAKSRLDHLPVISGSSGSSRTSTAHTASHKGVSTHLSTGAKSAPLSAGAVTTTSAPLRSRNRHSKSHTNSHSVQLESTGPPSSCSPTGSQRVSDSLQTSSLSCSGLVVYASSVRNTTLSSTCYSNTGVTLSISAGTHSAKKHIDSSRTVHPASTSLSSLLHHSDPLLSASFPLLLPPSAAHSGAASTSSRLSALSASATAGPRTAVVSSSLTSSCVSAPGVSARVTPGTPQGSSRRGSAGSVSSVSLLPQSRTVTGCSSHPYSAVGTSSNVYSSARDDGWREVTNRSMSSSRTKKVVVPSYAISRVIGRGGSNVNCIRDMSGAHVEIEKKNKFQTDRVITIKGSSESVKMAHAMITELSSSAETDVTQLLTKYRPLHPSVHACTSVTSAHTTASRQATVSSLSASLSSSSVAASNHHAGSCATTTTPGVTVTTTTAAFSRYQYSVYSNQAHSTAPNTTSSAAHHFKNHNYTASLAQVTSAHYVMSHSSATDQFRTIPSHTSVTRASTVSNTAPDISMSTFNTTNFMGAVGSETVSSNVCNLSSGTLVFTASSFVTPLSTDHSASLAVFSSSATASNSSSFVFAGSISASAQNAITPSTCVMASAHATVDDRDVLSVSRSNAPISSVNESTRAVDISPSIGDTSSQYSSSTFSLFSYTPIISNVTQRNFASVVASNLTTAASQQPESSVSCFTCTTVTIGGPGVIGDKLSGTARVAPVGAPSTAVSTSVSPLPPTHSNATRCHIGAKFTQIQSTTIGSSSVIAATRDNLPAPIGTPRRSAATPTASFAITHSLVTSSSTWSLAPGAHLSLNRARVNCSPLSASLGTNVPVPIGASYPGTAELPFNSSLTEPVCDDIYMTAPCVPSLLPPVGTRLPLPFSATCTANIPVNSTVPPVFSGSVTSTVSSLIYNASSATHFLPSNSSSVYSTGNVGLFDLLQTNPPPITAAVIGANMTCAASVSLSPSIQPRLQPPPPLPMSHLFPPQLSHSSIPPPTQLNQPPPNLVKSAQHLPRPIGVERSLKERSPYRMQHTQNMKRMYWSTGDFVQPPTFSHGINSANSQVHAGSIASDIVDVPHSPASHMMPCLQTTLPAQVSVATSLFTYRNVVFSAVTCCAAGVTVSATSSCVSGDTTWLNNPPPPLHHVHHPSAGGIVVPPSVPPPPPPALHSMAPGVQPSQNMMVGESALGGASVPHMMYDDMGLMLRYSDLPVRPIMTTFFSSSHIHLPSIQSNNTNHKTNPLLVSCSSNVGTRMYVGSNLPVAAQDQHIMPNHFTCDINTLLSSSLSNSVSALSMSASIPVCSSGLVPVTAPCHGSQEVCWTMQGHGALPDWNTR